MGDQSNSFSNDVITISDLTIHLPNGLGLSAFNLPSIPCPIIVKLILNLDPTVIPHCVTHDSMPSLGVNYSALSKEVYATLSGGLGGGTLVTSGGGGGGEEKNWRSVGDVLNLIAGVVFKGGHGGGKFVSGLRIQVELPRGFLHARSGAYVATYRPIQPPPPSPPYGRGEGSSNHPFSSTLSSSSTSSSHASQSSSSSSSTTKMKTKTMRMTSIDYTSSGRRETDNESQSETRDDENENHSGEGASESQQEINIERCELTFKLWDVRTECVIGLHPHEKREKQRVEVDVEVFNLKWDEGWDHKSFSEVVYNYLTSSTFGTIEALSDGLAYELLNCPPLSTIANSNPAEVKNDHLNSGDSGIPEIQVTLRKPSALPFAVPSISVRRSLNDYKNREKLGSGSPSQLMDGFQTDSIHKSMPAMSMSTPSDPIASISGSAPTTPLRSTTESPSMPRTKHSETNADRVFIALGSNIGDRIGHIKAAVKGLQGAGCILKGCSRLYESEPMYVEDQDRFINGVIEVSTSLPPLDLLRVLKRTEKSVGRRKTFTNGPRVIDLDLVFYGETIVKIGQKGGAEDEDGIGWLECPHASSVEREFVLRPLADIAPELVHPSLGVNISTLLSRLPQTQPPQLSPIIPFPYPALPLRLSTPSEPAIMAILNATPDSFSDGDVQKTTLDGSYTSFLDLINIPSPPDVIDIGGMSTRPNSIPCTLEEEIERVIPLIRRIRDTDNDSKVSGIAISVDTYRPEVAKKAVEAGASCINDVRGGREEGMLSVMAELDVPVVLMHSRGDSVSMTSSEMQDYASLGGVVEGVRKEMEEMVKMALQAGVKRWNIILDPGLGFAKSPKDHLVLLRNLPKLVGFGDDLPAGDSDGMNIGITRETGLKGYPLLIGGSRKGFVGSIIGRERREEAAKRGYGDAGLNSWCAQTGVVDVLRVHDPRGARESVKMSLAIRDA